MINLTQYVQIFEGGSSGHMSRPYDFPELTLKDLREIVLSVFGYSDAVEFTEKLDGTNIQASMNNQNEVIFIRNKGDLNSERGGMSVEDMAEKWKDKPGVQKTFVSAGKILERIFKRIGSKFFNPDPNTRLFANCECIVAGKTNIMPYIDDSVDFHNIWVYKKDGNEWKKDKITRDGLDIIEKAIDKDDKAQLTPKLIMKTNEQSRKIATKWCDELNKLWKQEGLGEDDTLQDWEQSRFKKIAPEWMTDEDGAIFRRWFLMDKSVNMRILKKTYKDHVDELSELDKKGYKKYVSDVMGPIDKMFINLGTDAINMIQGLTNSITDEQAKKVKNELISDLNIVIDKVNKSDDMELKAKLALELSRLGDMNTNIHDTEGIVFTWKGRMMKLTAGFGPANQIINLQYKLNK